MSSSVFTTPSTRTTVRLSAKARRTHEQPIGFLMKQAVTNPDLISLAAGLVDQETLPVDETRETLLELFTDPTAARDALQYGTTEGYSKLRGLAVAHLEELEGRPAREMGLVAEHVLVTTGSQQLLYLVSDVLIDPGDVVLIGVPEYFVYMGTLESLGARIVGVPMDDDGIIPEALEDVLERLERQGMLGRVKMLYCGSYYQNPSGVTLTAARRPAVLETIERWSRHGRIFVLEDAAYRELFYDRRSPCSIRSFDQHGGSVILTQTFSKSYSPGLKSGYTVVPEALLGPILQQKGNHDFGSCNFTQHLLAEALASGRYAHHVEQLRSAYATKLQVMADSLETAFSRRSVPARWTRPRGGLYVWLVLPEEVDTTRRGALFNECVRRGVLYVPGEYCFPPETEARASDPLGGPRNTLRLTFGNVSPAALSAAVDRLADALARVAGR